MFWRPYVNEKGASLLLNSCIRQYVSISSMLQRALELRCTILAVGEDPPMDISNSLLYDLPKRCSLFQSGQRVERGHSKVTERSQQSISLWITMSGLGVAFVPTGVHAFRFRRRTERHLSWWNACDECRRMTRRVRFELIIQDPRRHKSVWKYC